MENTIRARLHDLTLRARDLLTSATSDLLEGVYGLQRDGRFAPAERLPALVASAVASETRARLERLLTDERAAGLAPREAAEKLTKEVAFTWLNRIAAFKMLEARRLIRQGVARGAESNGFKLWLTQAGNEEELARNEAGSLPQDTLGEGPRDVAYRRYLLALCAEMAGQVRVLFDPDTLPSRLFPRPRALAELLALVNDSELAAAWAEDETIGWIYQSFNAEELEAAFREVRLSGAKFEAADIPAVTQLFTPRPVVRFLVENALGRLWLQMHSDSRLRERLDYLVPDVDAPPVPAKPVREITLLDPACGTMHFGLVAFDLFAEMYREELERAGDPGWPERSSVREASEIPAAILEHNLFGIDIDLRAVQLSALTLHLKARSLNPTATIQAANLACADVLLLNGKRLDAFIAAMRFSRPIYERVIRAVWARLRDANQLGSLLRLEADIRALVASERERFRLEGQGRLPFPELRGLFEEEADDDAYWDILEAQLVQAFDEFAREQAREGADQSYFAGEATKGMRLLDVMLRRYDVVVTNPPYMSQRKMNDRLKALVVDAYPAAKADLYAAFIQRCLEFASQHGRVGMLTMHSFMFISSYEGLRSHIRKTVAIEALAHYGPALFSVGNPGTLQTAAYVLRAEPDAARRDAAIGTYFRLVRGPDAAGKQRGLERAVAALRAGAPARIHIVYRYRQADFDAIPGSPWVYWITPGLRRLFQTLPKLGEIAQPHCGMATSANVRFLRYWWEVGGDCVGQGYQSAQEAEKSGKRWFPYMKGGEFCRWWGNQEYVINWENNGREVKAWTGSLYAHWSRQIKGAADYFRRGVTWTDLTSGSFTARLSPGGFIFDVAGSSCFPADIPLVLGIMNSTWAQYALKLINPTMHVQVGDLARLPIPRADSEKLHAYVERAVALVRADSAEDETTYEFVAPPAWPEGEACIAARRAELATVEHELDEAVWRLYGIGSIDRSAIEAELVPVPGGEADDSPEVDAAEGLLAHEPDRGPSEALASPAQAARWVSYAAGIVLGRFQPGVVDALGAGRFAPAVADQLRTLAAPDGIAVLDKGHPDDLAERATRALELMVGEGQVETLLAAATGGRDLREWLARDSFKAHVQRYRKRPIYWLLQSPRKLYGVYLFHERVTRDTLHLLRGMRYLGGKIARVGGEIAERRELIAATPQGPARRRLEREAEAAEALLADLAAFDKALAAVTARANSRGEVVGWAPEPDDGVLINLAPLAALMTSWSVEPKKCWEALEQGRYDWSHTAMRYWPDRVLEKCRTNRSYAIAHGVAEAAGATIHQTRDLGDKNGT